MSLAVRDVELNVFCPEIRLAAQGNMQTNKKLTFEPVARTNEVSMEAKALGTRADVNRSM